MKSPLDRSRTRFGGPRRSRVDIGSASPQKRQMASFSACLAGRPHGRAAAILLGVFLIAGMRVPAAA